MRAEERRKGERAIFIWVAIASCARGHFGAQLAHGRLITASILGRNQEEAAGRVNHGLV